MLRGKYGRLSVKQDKNWSEKNGGNVGSGQCAEESIREIKLEDEKYEEKAISVWGGKPRTQKQKEEKEEKNRVEINVREVVYWKEH